MNITSIIKLALWFGICFFIGYIFVGTVFAQALEVSGNPGIVKTQPFPGTESKKQDEMKCTAGYCQLEGSLFVDPALGAKRFELPETSTPTARSNKVVIWLQVEGDTQTVKVMFENGLVKELISNSTP